MPIEHSLALLPTVLEYERQTCTINGMEAHADDSDHSGESVGRISES
jgi:hypothetical protein